MEEEIKSENLLQVYNVGDVEVLPSQVDMVLCVMVRRGILVAGFNPQKDLLTLRYHGYEAHKTVWDMEFFGRVADTEPLLEAPEKVRAVFVLSDKNMVIPNDLYKEQHAKVWLRQIHYIEHDDAIEAFQLEQDRAMYMLAIPGDVKNWITNKFPNASIRSLAEYQFLKPPKIGLCLQSCVTAEQVCCTLHIDGNLLWHKVMDYAAAEDIVFEGKFLCKENNYFATKLTILFNSLTGGEFPVLNDYSQYYAAMKSGEGARIHAPWDAPTALIKQLLQCVL
jgi:Protein of unknown function (DUF3822)